MPTNPLEAFATVLFVHAHPDDETLATGVVLAELAERGVRTAVLTASRGEAGEVAAGDVAPGSPELAAARERELACAAAELGVSELCFLGRPPASASGVEHRYTDSGMRWVDDAETLAGPGDDAAEDALSLADPSAVTADIVAYASAVGADVIVGYDPRGGYGHPDHIALHSTSAAAASELGIPFVEVVSWSRSDAGRPPADDAFWVERPDLLDTLVRALRCYRTQVTVDGTNVVHVGGQVEPIPTSVGLRRA
ncbi:PIG-L deacetylase family protein [Nigerium massiliense]|uniref:PIG-L deacetylase family protein n=1 Tax=Nigerium massiliense TaxID=1522317 RepID=UPI00058EA6C9|nr:PIG-L family deacetylase [Nigerium massiliense]